MLGAYWLDSGLVREVRSVKRGACIEEREVGRLVRIKPQAESTN